MQKNHRLATHVKPERYEIMLKPDLINFTFIGEESIYLTITKLSREITIHSADLQIDSVEFDHGKSNISSGKVVYDKVGEMVVLTFPKNIKIGKGILKLKFTGTLNDKMRGFYRSKFSHEGKVKHMATTQFESTDARRAFPCFDEPSLKAIFDVTLMIPAQTTAISNTIETSIIEHESGFKLVKFASTPKMSTYLLAFIVGEFEYIEKKTKDGVLVRVFTTPGKKNQAEFALATSIKCLEFYNSYFAFDYPLPVLDLIAIPDFAAGAMENWGAVTYRESTLLVDESLSSAGNKQWVALVIAHELAHMWFGDLVTMEWWTDLWLNEGFASFIEYLAVDHIFPDWDIWTQFLVTEMGEAYQLDSLKNTHPIEIEVKHPDEIAEIFDKVSYSKGASILRMLMSYLGEKDFQKGLQDYLKKFAYGNAKTEDLWLSLEKASKKPVNKIMKNWTSKAGHPLISVKRKGESRRRPASPKAGGKLELTQSRFFSSPISKKEAKDKTTWSIPLVSLRDHGVAKQSSTSNNKIATGSLNPRNDEVLLMDKKSILIDGPKNDQWAKLNSGETTLVRVDYPHEMLKKLEMAIKAGQLSAVDRIGLIRDSFDLAQSGNSPTTLALELALSYVNEEDYTVWATLTGHLSQLDSLLAYENCYEDFRVFARQIYAGIANKMGWQNKNQDKHTDSLLRGIVLNMLGGFGDEETIKKAQSMFGSKKIDPDLRGVVYNLVAKNGGINEYNTLLEMYKQENNQQEKDRIGRSLGLFKSRPILEKTLKFAISKDVRFQNSLQIIASVWGNPQSRYLAWEFVKNNWQMLKERYAGGHYFTRVFAPASEFTKIEDAKDILSFIKKNPAPEAKRTIAQVVEQIYSNAAWLKRDKQGIKKFLQTMVESMN